MMRKHFLQIIIKNTSTLDYSLPILKGIRDHFPESKITILYCVANKKQILRNSIYIDNFCKEFKVHQLDFSNFIHKKLAIFKSIYRKLFSESYSDRTTRISNLSLKNLKFFFLRYLKYVERLIGNLIVDLPSILNGLDPDVIFFDNRSVSSFYGRNYFFKYFEKRKKRVILLPHAPHYVTSTGEFCRFDEKNDDVMPSYTEHWMPFKYGEPWLVVPEKKEQFIHIGYPGLDSQWYRYLIQKKKRNKYIKCLVMTRKFFPKEHIRTKKCDHFTLNYNEARKFYLVLANIEKKFPQIQYHIKPHPSGSKIENENLLKESGIKNFILSYESFYEVLPKVDIVFSQYTTSLMLPLAYKIPTLILEDSSQRFVNESWGVLKKLYTGFEYYTQEKELEEMFSRLINNFINGHNNTDYHHLREYFEDNSVNKAINRLELILSESQKS